MKKFPIDRSTKNPYKVIFYYSKLYVNNLIKTTVTIAIKSWHLKLTFQVVTFATLKGFHLMKAYKIKQFDLIKKIK